MMTFVDGPAAGEILAMRCTPVILRVVRNPLARDDDRRWDCLNYTDDVAKPHEEIFLYILRSPPTRVHLRMSPRSQSGFYGMGEYHHLADDVDDATLRDNALFSAWREANKDRLMPDWYQKHLEEAARVAQVGGSCEVKP